jgi:hypothetical protein
VVFSFISLNLAGRDCQEPLSTALGSRIPPGPESLFLRSTLHNFLSDLLIDGWGRTVPAWPSVLGAPYMVRETPMCAWPYGFLSRRCRRRTGSGRYPSPYRVKTENLAWLGSLILTTSFRLHIYRSCSNTSSQPLWIRCQPR